MALVLQAGTSDALEFGRDTRQGIVTAKALCMANTVQEALFGAPPDIGILLPEVPVRGVRLDPSSQIYHVQLNFEGLVGEGGEEYNLQGTLGNDPVESSVNYLLVKRVYNGTVPDPNTGRVFFPETLTQDDTQDTWSQGLPQFTADLPVTFPGNADAAAQADADAHRNPMHGVEDYRAPGLIWMRKHTAATFPRGIVQRLGRIDTPPGNPPELDGNRTWLKIRAVATWRGNCWQIEEAWELSGRFGWVPELYR